MTTIKIITGSTRPQRFGPQVANWIKTVADEEAGAAGAEGDGVQFELVDLAEVNLPLLDEATPPMMNQPQNEHTKKWAALVGEADGFVFVTPEYNHSVGAALKNAIDYLIYQWAYKPVAFASYGSLAGGSRAVEHLRGIAGELKLYDLREQVMIPNYWNQLDDSGRFVPAPEQEETARTMLRDLIFWTAVMKAPREKLAARR
ncbi:MAG: NADPH-dependent oxidoreductase [Spirochaetaceae bacterium]|nr:MAG: NADPH-dependent oxidoreductase [Spirochaetaceae bacterium]